MPRPFKLFRWLDVDLDKPLPSVTLSDDEGGWAVLVRRAGRPLAYWIERIESNSHISEEMLAQRIGRDAGAGSLREQIYHNIRVEEDAHMPSLTIAVCTHNRPDRLARCLKGIAQILIPDTMVPPEIIVIDNAPPDSQTREVVRSHTGVRYVVEPIPGLNFGRNRALAEAGGEWVAFMDDDVVPDPGWLKGLSRAWRDNPDARAVTGLVLPFALETEAQILFELAGGFRRGCQTIRHEPHAPNNPLYPTGAGSFGAGANMVFHRGTLRSLGGFDEALDTGPPLPGGGDLDAFFSIAEAGHVLVYEPEALVFHEHRRDLEGLRHQYYTWGLGFMAYVTKRLRNSRVEMRRRFQRLVVWWFRYQIRNLVAALRGRHPLPPEMILAELKGGVVGLAGEYDRSQKRVAERRSGVAVRSEPVSKF
jgi:GT2 family glycosyltransferase